jgi:hypothetical protein
MKTKSFLQTIYAAFLGAVMIVPAQAQGGDLSWSEATGSSDDVSTWIRQIMVAVMAIFVMAAIIMGSLAFKQLAADGNWKDFWSKIAGAVGMFVTPVAIYWAVGLA